MTEIFESLTGLVDLISGFIDLVVYVVDFVISTIKDLVYMTQLLGDMLVQLPDYFGWLPSAVLTNFMLIISVVVIYKIIGREG